MASNESINTIQLDIKLLATDIAIMVAGKQHNISLFQCSRPGARGHVGGYARQVVCYQLKFNLGMSYAEIGRAMGYTNHSGPLKNVRVAKDLFQVNIVTRRQIRLTSRLINLAKIIRYAD